MRKLWKKAKDHALELVRVAAAVGVIAGVVVGSTTVLVASLVVGLVITVAQYEKTHGVFMHA